MENGKKPINARTAFDNNGTITSDFNEYFGLTKREYFAGLAMQSMLSNPSTGTSINGQRYIDPVLVAKGSIQFADELLKQLEK
jgi:hypothetical protein